MACRVNAVALLAADAESGLLTVPLRQTRRLCLTMGSADRHLSARIPHVSHWADCPCRLRHLLFYQCEWKAWPGPSAVELLWSTIPQVPVAF